MLFLFPLLILFGLIAVPDAAAKAALDAALLWWTRVLPSLLPYLIASSLLLRSGLLSRLPNRAVPFLLLPFGVLGGYPVGAKLAGKLYRDGALSLFDARRADAFCNLPNPVFLISVVAVGMFRDARTALPLLSGIFGTALLGLIPLSRIRVASVRPSEPPALARDLPAAIGDGVQAILNIGGCLVFASVLGALLEAIGVFRLFGANAPTARAITLGLFEMTSGVSAVAALPASLPLRLALTAFFIQFGGVSVLLQSASYVPLSLPRYCLVRLCSALISALTVFLLTPLFCPAVVVPTLATRAEMLQNGFDLLAVSLSSALGLLLVFVFTFGLSKTKMGS
ncbi:MAG: hypothetical protein IKP38_06700 [Clostridia bacterium]|nr:hypothetical protein [Clostridia bacterium]